MELKAVDCGSEFRVPGSKPKVAIFRESQENIGKRNRNKKPPNLSNCRQDRNFLLAADEIQLFPCALVENANPATEPSPENTAT